MASFAIHIAAASEYLKNNKNEQKEAFLKGVVDIDLAEDKDAAHYANVENIKNAYDSLSQRTNLFEYAKNNNINTAYERGKFFHLVTDYYFYCAFFSKNLLEKYDDKVFRKALYEDYYKVTNFLIRKYKIVIPRRVLPFFENRIGFAKFLKKKELKKFINFLSTINLKEIYKIVLKNGQEHILKYYEK